MWRAVVVVTVVACGHGAQTQARHVDPPPGNGWWCSASPGLCDRDQRKCEDYAARVGAERPCAPLAEASCFASESGTYACASEPGACSTLEAYAQHHGEVVVQRCTRVR